MTEYRPKLIEVALPLAAINTAAAREKSIRHGHPSTLHLWWARRPLAAARAVIWASLVDDPSGDDSLSLEQQDKERQRLFQILEELIKWENSNEPHVLAQAKAEIDRCFPEGPPPILDPFGGGGAIPLEAQRLGLKAVSGDLNPVAVLIQKAMIEIPPRFAGRPPVHPDIQKEMTTWERAQGLAADVEAYGQWMRDEAKRRIGHLYPDATGPSGEKLTPIAWIWARTVRSPDPTWKGEVPLVSSWVLSKKKGKPTIWVEPIIDTERQTISYQVCTGGKPTHEGTVHRGGATCIATGASIPLAYIRQEGMDGKLGRTLLAVVAESPGGRAYLDADIEHISAAEMFSPAWLPTARLPAKGLGFRVQAYGVDEWWKLYAPRQLVALTTLTDLLTEVRGRVMSDAVNFGLPDDGVPVRDGGVGATAYADAVITYLAFVIDKCANLWSGVVSWMNDRGAFRETFARQAISMTWDHAEANPFSGRGGSWDLCLDKVQMAIAAFSGQCEGRAVQMDARAAVREAPASVISTDPPYYDNVGYADLSDFFYVWLRHSLRDVWPEQCATLLTPKSDELIADPTRHGGRVGAEAHFESGMADFMAEVSRAQLPDAPATVYYAYKATETKEGDTRSTGWATFLQAVLDGGLQVTATWPVRTESPGRIRATGANALASSIVLACRPRPDSSPLASRGEFIAALRQELPEAVRMLQTGNVAPVDLPQSTIGPGIKVFSRYAKVVEAGGFRMSVTAALSIINDVLAEVLDGEESELDPDTRFAVSWYTQHGWNPANSGEADGLARAKNTSLDGLRDAGVGVARAGKFRLHERNELDESWNPQGDDRLTVWEATQYLVIALERSESEAAELLKRLGGVADRAKQLTYVLFQKATDNGWADEAAAYNGLITAWPALQSAAASMSADAAQESLL